MAITLSTNQIKKQASKEKARSKKKQKDLLHHDSILSLPPTSKKHPQQETEQNSRIQNSGQNFGRADFFDKKC
jgi:hypothetical protein